MENNSKINTTYTIHTTSNTQTAESVSPGHPDAYMDLVVNALLDEALRKDPDCKFACDGLAKGVDVFLGGETNVEFTDEEIQHIVEDVTKYVGYDHKPIVTSLISKQSPEIAQGVETEGAGDQGTITGFAIDDRTLIHKTNWNRELSQYDFIPLSKSVADAIIRYLFNLYLEGKEEMKYRGNPYSGRMAHYMKPDMKAQVTITDNRIEKVVIACSHVSMDEFDECDLPESYTYNDFVGELRQTVDDFLYMNYFMIRNHKEPSEYITVNGTGSFAVPYYGPLADSGVVGRKTTVDLYGLNMFSANGGGTLNGKDASKVDKTAALYTRWVAKNVVAAGWAKGLRIDVSYCIGQEEPLSVNYYWIKPNLDPLTLETELEKHFSFKVADMKKLLSGFNNYATACQIGWMSGGSHKINFEGQMIDIPWEKTEKAKELSDWLKTQKEMENEEQKMEKAIEEINRCTEHCNCNENFIKHYKTI